MPECSHPAGRQDEDGAEAGGMLTLPRPRSAPYSHAVREGGFVFLSGQTPLRPDTIELVPGGIEVQTRQVFSNLEAVLAAAGLLTV